MAQLDNQAPVVADDVASDGGADANNDAQQDDQQQKPEPDGTEFYEDDKPADTPEGDDRGDDQQDEDDGEGGDDADLDPIEAPKSWKDADKEIFAGLPREAQEIVARREGERDSYLRGQAAKHEQAQQQILTQAQQELADIHTRKAQEYQQLAAQLMPQPPDPRLLYTGNPEDERAYHRQAAAHQSAQAQQQELLHRAQTEEAAASQAEQAKEQQQAAAELRTLHNAFPDWFDEGSLDLKPDVVTRLQPIGEALGYPPELLAQARAVDFTALDTAAGWKADADKWRAFQKRKMEGVRAAKKLTPIAKPGAAKGAATPTDDAVKLLYPND